MCKYVRVCVRERERESKRSLLRKKTFSKRRMSISSLAFAKIVFLLSALVFNERTKGKNEMKEGKNARKDEQTNERNDHLDVCRASILERR